MLHTVNKSAFTSSRLRDCLAAVKAGDAVLLLNEGVYGGARNSPCAREMEALAGQGCRFYSLKEDAEKREIATRLLDCVALIDYADFVDLAAHHQHTQSWY